MRHTSSPPRWQLWIDSGGTFTDIVARRPDGSITTHKLLSDNPDHYPDAALAGIRRVLGIASNVAIPVELIAAVHMGTTVATNALLERTGERTVLFITRGFRDALRIAYQNRPKIFARHIVLPERLYSKVVEVEERVGAHGEVLTPLDVERTRRYLQAAHDEGYRSLAIVLMHGYRYQEHEQQVAAIIAEANATTVVEPSWQADVTPLDHLVLKRIEARPDRTAIGTTVDPVMLEVFNNLYMSIAEQMGLWLENTAYSVNIKERLDFSCALFDAQGQLIANAPHLPVHLGSMGESIKTVMRENAGHIKPGHVYVLNAPYNGGIHLPDITVMTPVFDDAGKHILVYVGSRGHHADIGGITPGSMPPDSTVVEEEGVLIDNFLLMEEGRLREQEMVALLASGRYPVRNVEQNMADLRAMIAANEKGVQELRRMVEHFGLDVVHAYMRHVQDNAEEAVRRVIDVLTDGQFSYEMDNGGMICVRISIDKTARSATLDFTGTSDQLPNNYNASSAVCMAAVLYVFSTLVDDDIPLNAGCLKPLHVIIPEGSMLRPRYPAAVVAGTVETSQCVTDALYGALGVMGASQGTMNNFTFGNHTYQYYETICGGSGAGEGFDGTSCVHTHMTNTRLTDPEVLEWRFPVMLERFAIRRGSGGRGTWNGGAGTIRRVRFIEAMTAAILSGHRRIPPYGMAGGEPGQVGRNWVERVDGSIVPLGGADKAELPSGEVFVIETPGGGYGKPEASRRHLECGPPGALQRWGWTCAAGWGKGPADPPTGLPLLLQVVHPGGYFLHQ